MTPPWADTLDQALSDFESFGPLSAERLGQMAGWLLVEQIYNDLTIDGYTLSRQRVLEVVLAKDAAESLEEGLAGNFARAIEELSKYVSTAIESKQPADLTLELVLRLHRLTVGEGQEGAGVLRNTSRNPLYPEHDPCSQSELPPLLDMALDWFSAETVRELHPVEQAALVHVRLSDLQPFSKANGRVIRLASSLYTMRVGLPPIIVTTDLVKDYYQALLTGFHMITVPLVGLFAGLLAKTLQRMKQILETS